MKFRIFSVFAFLIIGIVAMTSCDIGIAKKNYSDKVTDENKFEFVLLDGGESYGVKVKAGEYLPETVFLPDKHENKPVTEILAEGFGQECGRRHNRCDSRRPEVR